MKRALAVGIAALALAGCASRVDYNKESLNLSLGMSKSSVQGVLGTPRRTDVNQDRERWIYWNPAMIGFTPIDNEQLATDRLVVTFKDGKVIRWGQQTAVDDAMESSQKMIERSMDAARQAQQPQK